MRYFLASLCLCGCAINTASLQTAKSLEEGRVRIAAGISTGLHLEEVGYSRLAAGKVKKGGEPDKNRPYQRPLAMGVPDLFDAMFLSAISFHAGVGLDHDVDLNASVSVALMAASGRIGLKYQFLDHAGRFFAAVNPTALYAISQGGSSPEDEPTDGQQSYLQYVLNDKTVTGFELPILMTWRTPNVSYNLSPMLAYYNVDITKAFDPNLVGTYRTGAGGLTAGTYFRTGKVSFGPELSLLVLNPFGNGKIVNLNYAIGLMSDF